MFRNRRVLAFLACGVVLFACGAGLLATWALTSAKPAQLSWDPPTFRKSVMSFGYKVYANPQVDEGKYFLSKVVLKNTGGRPIRD
jgi:predicted membrane metal-binding protein